LVVNSRPVRGFILLAAIAALATSAPLVHWAAPAPAMTVAAGRVMLAGLLLWCAAPAAPRMWWRLPRRERWLVALAGGLLGVHFGVWITSLYFTSTAASLALVAMNPVFAALFGLVLGDRVRGREWIGIAIAGAGCALLAGGDWEAGGAALVGDGLALLGAATAAAYLVVGRRMRSGLPLGSYLAVVNGIAGLLLLGGAVAAGAPALGFDWHVYVAIGASAVVPSLIGHTMLNAAVRRTPTHLVALAILGEPVGASVLTWIWFGEVPPGHAAIGGAVILVGIAVGFVGRKA
jgi:drug/metabolite transporter (DMT)-like permease